MIYSKMELNNTRNKKRIIIVLLVLLLSIFLCGCKKDVDENKDGKVEEKTYDDTIFPNEMKKALNGKKVYVTSIGQSKDIEEYREVV